MPCNTNAGVTIDLTVYESTVGRRRGLFEAACQSTVSACVETEGVWFSPSERVEV